MTKMLLCFAILAVCTSAASAAKHKPKAAAPAATAAAPLMWQPGPTAADKAMYAKNKHDSGIK
jgi:hypothetical protein